MTEQAVMRRRPPNIRPYIAVLLELGMLADFAFSKSWIGVALWLGYLWFSATWAMLTGRWDN